MAFAFQRLLCGRFGHIIDIVDFKNIFLLLRRPAVDSA